MIVNSLFSTIYYFPYNIHNFYRVFEIVILCLISKFEPINFLVRNLDKSPPSCKISRYPNTYEQEYMFSDLLQTLPMDIIMIVQACCNANEI